MKKHETVSLNRGLRIALLASLILSTMIGVLPYSSLAAPAAAAVGTTYTVTSTSCTGPGSIVEAIALANANPGEDTIQLVPGLQIDAANAITCPPIGRIQGSDYFIAAVTDSLIIEGNGGALNGKMAWIDQSGNQSFSVCPKAEKDGLLIAATMPGFLRIGEASQDNTDLTVTIKNLRVQQFNQVAMVSQKASLVLEDVDLKEIWNMRPCSDPAIWAFDDASVTLRRTTFEDYVSFQKVTIGKQTYFGAIFGGDAGDLTIEDSQFFSIDSGYPQNTIYWHGRPGSTVNIVSTLFGRSGREDSPNLGRVGGIFVDGHAETNIVNSLWNNDIYGEVDIGDQIMNNSSGDMNIIASTLIWNTDQCDADILCSDPNTTPNLISRYGTGRIHFKQSAIGLNFVSTAPAASLLTLFDVGTNGFTADADTWIQPTQLQDTATLQGITGQPALRTDTDPPAFDIPYNEYWSTALGMPSLGTSGNPGQLLDVIPDANCGNTNELINPIDGTTCIDKDLLGSDRWDINSIDNRRNIGALQLAQAPLLQVVGVGDGAVELNWTHTAEPPSGTITGYVLAYREKGTSTWSTVNIPDASTLAYKVTGLTNGVEYEFQVEGTVGTLPGGEPILSGYPSNIVTGIPIGPVGPPVVTATPGNGQVDLSWTKPPDLGGNEIKSYVVRWRTREFANLWEGVQLIDAPTTQFTVTGLTNGQEYVFEVIPKSADGTPGSKGTTSATPVAPGTVIIHKQVVPKPTGLPQFAFWFTQNINGGGGFGLDYYFNTKKVFNDVAPGSYEVTEADPQGTGYELTNITCVDDDPNGVASTGDVAARTATINVDSGETVQCTFYNAEEETVVIEKRTIPPSGSGFTFSDDIGTPNSFTLDDAQTRTFTHVPQGDYQVSEDAMPGYELTAIDCTVEGVSVPGDLTTRTAAFTLQQAGGSAHCTFTNSKLGTIIMRKETLPDGAPDAFGYTISGPDTNDSGTMTDGGSTQIDNAKSGTWELTESLPAADWHLGDISCTSTLGTSTFTKDIDNLKATVELAPGDTMDCTFTNVEDETITVEKVTVPAGDTTTSFAFTGSGSIGDIALKDGESQSFSVDADAGPFTLTEGDPSGAGYEVTEIRCVNSQTGAVTLGDPGTRSVDLDTQPGESQHCTFTNERHGKVIIRKATAPAGGSGFNFYGGFGYFSLDDGQAETFLDVTPGVYTVSEVDPSSAGYGLTGIRCTDSDPNGTASTLDLASHTATINVDAGETVECTFTNSKLDTISVFKTTLPPGGTGFGFGGDFGLFTLDDGGLTTFDNVVPGAYTINEDDPTPAYDLALILCHDAATGQFFQGDVANRQVDLDLQAGHQVLCEFVNVQRGTIIIEKAPGSGTGYDFSGDLGDFTLDSGREQTFINQPVGEYTVTEQTPPGDTLTGLTCTDSDGNGVASTGDVAANTATINLDPGETVRCTYTNQPGGSIVIKKTAASGPSGPFTFLDNIQTPATFELSDGGEQRFDGILPGTYTVQETAFPDGSGLAEIDCVDSDANGTPSDDDMRSKTAIIHLDPGETVECTFTNEWLNRIYLPIIFR